MLFYKNMMKAGLDTALNATVRFGEYFLLPGLILFAVFFAVLSISQIAFARGYTLCPKWRWLISVPVGMTAACLLKLFGGLLVFARRLAKSEDHRKG